MRVNSFIAKADALEPVEIEVQLVAGLPQFQFVGLPDQLIKESQLRIKSAIKTSGFFLPKAEQIIVNLRPAHLKKTSRGLEFAVAAGILWATGQIAKPDNLNGLFLYGELGLDGSVYQPEDIPKSIWGNYNQLVTGQEPNVLNYFNGSLYKVNHIRDLALSEKSFLPELHPEIIRPEIYKGLMFAKNQMELIQLAALGGHSVLLAGPSGSGKTLVSEVIHSLRALPSEEQARQFLKNKWNQGDRGIQVWLPYIRPHTSITLQGLVGGGSQLSYGELSRADGGVLVLDELLEFKAQVIEALREPLESGRVRLARASGFLEYSSQFQLIGTTNLCPCGDFVPNEPISCRYSLYRCRSYGEKLSGPLVDRFQILGFSQDWRVQRKTSWEQIHTKLEDVRAWLKGGSRQKMNALLSEEEILGGVPTFFIQKLIDSVKGSHRRRLSTLRIAQSIADLDKREKISSDDFEQAMNWTTLPFEKLKKWL